MSDSESHAPCDNSAPPSSGSHAEPKPNTDRRSTPTQPEHSALERLVDVYHGRLPCGYLEKLKAEELEAEELEAKELAAVKSQPETLEELILENVNRIFCTEQEQIAQDIIARYTEEQDEKVLKDIERILETRCKENDDQQRGGLDLQDIKDEGMSQEQRDIQEPEMLQKQGPVM